MIIAALALCVAVTPAFAQSNNDIPVWVKGIAEFWVSGNITDTEYAEALKFLIESKVLVIDTIQIETVTPNACGEGTEFDVTTSLCIASPTITPIQPSGVNDSNLQDRIVDLESQIANGLSPEYFEIKLKLEQAEIFIEQLKINNVGSTNGNEEGYSTSQYFDLKNQLADKEATISALQNQITHLESNGFSSEYYALKMQLEQAQIFIVELKAQIEQNP